MTVKMTRTTTLPLLPISRPLIKAARRLQSFFDSKEDEESSWAVVRLQKNLDDTAARQKVQIFLFGYFHC